MVEAIQVSFFRIRRVHMWDGIEPRSLYCDRLATTLLHCTALQAAAGVGREEKVDAHLDPDWFCFNTSIIATGPFPLDTWADHVRRWCRASGR